MRDKIDKAISIHNTMFSNTIIEFESLPYFMCANKYTTKESGSFHIEGFILTNLDMIALADTPTEKLEYYLNNLLKNEMVKKEFHKDHKYIIHLPYKTRAT